MFASNEMERRSRLNSDNTVVLGSSYAGIFLNVMPEMSLRARLQAVFNTQFARSLSGRGKGAEARRHVESLFRFTYRRDFPELSPYRISSDSGWGCMLRAAQMLMACALQRHMLGRGKVIRVQGPMHYDIYLF
jgi:hypothetical protein